MKDFSVNTILNFSLCFLILSYFFKESFAIIRPTKPVIKSAQQISENEIMLEWQDGSLQEDFNEPNLKRYRIFFRNDNNDNLYSWPGQVIKTNSDIKGSHYVTLNASSSFDCYIQCLKNPRCEFATFKNINDKPYLNCELKNDLIYDNKNNFDVNPDVEYMKITDYSNNIILKNVPAQKNYTYLVAVYDDDLQEWSHVSEESEKVIMNIEITLNYEKIGSKSALLKWRQTGVYKNYAISRYNIKVKSNQDKGVKSLSKNLNKLSKYTLEPDYYQINTRNFVGQVSKEEDCHKKCLLKYNCVRYVYFNDNRCYLLSYFNIINGVYRNKDAKVFSIRSDSHTFKLKNLKPESDYLVKLEFRTPYGDIGYSNEIKITTKSPNEVDSEDEYDENDYDSELFDTNDEDNENDDDDIYKDLNDSITNHGIIDINSINSTSPNINENNNNNNNENENKEENNGMIENYDFKEDGNDGNNKIKTTTKENELHKEDKLDEDEYYYIYEQEGNDYFEGDVVTRKIKKRKTTTPKPRTTKKHLDDQHTTAEYDNNNNNYDYGFDNNNDNNDNNENENIDGNEIEDSSNGNKENEPNKANILSPTTKAPVKEDFGKLIIDSNEIITKNSGDRLEILCRYDGNTRKELNWKKESSSNENLSTEKSSFNSLSLVFNSLTQYNNGYYVCSLVDKPNEYKKVQLIVTNKPSKPKIVNASILEKEKIYIKFEKFDNGGLNITNLFVEWSEDFNNKNKSVNKKSVGMNEHNKISDNELLIDTSIPENNKVRISAVNEAGSSETSDTFSIDCIHKNCTNPRKGLVLEPGNQNPYLTKKTKIVIFTLIALLIVMILVYIAYDCYSSNREKSKNDRSKSNNENEPLNKP